MSCRSERERLLAELRAKDERIDELLDRLAARNLPEYKTFMSQTPQPQPRAGRWVTDPTGIVRTFIPADDEDDADASTA